MTTPRILYLMKKTTRALYLPTEAWLRTVDAMRHCAHSEPSEAHAIPAHLGLDCERQKEIHDLSDAIVLQLGLEHDCVECDPLSAGHTEPVETCGTCYDEHYIQKKQPEAHR